MLLSVTLSTACSRPGPGDLPAVGELASVPRSALEGGISLKTGIGASQRRAPTINPRAQQFYDQGLAYQASFDWVRSSRSFHQALAEDPQLAAAHLGLARAFLGLGAPVDALRLAKRAVAQGENLDLPPRERHWLRLGELQMTAVALNGGRRHRGHQAYLQAIEAFLEAYPDDLHARVLRGNGDFSPDGWGQVGIEGSLAWYRRTLEIDADFFPAHHFLTHSLENLGRYEEALEHARRYAELAPSVPHAHHMVAHIAPRLNGWSEARVKLEVADALHRQSFDGDHLAPAEDWHFGHNLRLLGVVNLYLRDLPSAEASYRETFDLPYGGHRAGSYCAPWIEFLLLSKRFEEVLDAAESCEERGSALAGVLGAAYSGEAVLALGRLEKAKADLSRAQAHLRDLLPTLGTGHSERSYGFTGQLAVDLLDLKIRLLDQGSEDTQGQLLALAEYLAFGHSVDAWAKGWPRLGELANFAADAGKGQLASRLRELRDLIRPSANEAPESPGCHGG